MTTHFNDWLKVRVAVIIFNVVAVAVSLVQAGHLTHRPLVLLVRLITVVTVSLRIENAQTVSIQSLNVVNYL